MVCLPNSFAHDPKVAALSAEARWLLVRCWCHCSEHMTDGVIAASDLRVIMGAKRRHVAELVIAGLAHELQTGSVVLYDYLEHNPTRADAERQRVRTRERVQSHRKRQCNALRNALQPPLPNALQGALQGDCALSLDLSISGDPECIPAFKPSSEALQVARASKKGAAKPTRAGWREAQLALIPDESHARIASKSGVDLELELAKFKDHDFARPRADAAATFRNWLRNARPAAPLNGKPPGLVDHEARRLEQNTAARHRAWLLDQAKDGAFGGRLKALAEAGSLDVTKLEAWHERQRQKQAGAGESGPGGPAPLGGLLAAALGGREASNAR